MRANPSFALTILDVAPNSFGKNLSYGSHLIGLRPELFFPSNPLQMREALAQIFGRVTLK